MNNSFEKFIQQNREAFDTQEPGSHIAENIQQGIKKKSNNKIFRITLRPPHWVAAATVAGIIVSGILLFRSSADQEISTNIAATPDATTIQQSKPVTQENVITGDNGKQGSIALPDETFTEQKRLIFSQIGNTESASERLSSVLVATELQNTDKDIIDVLVKTMNTDPNNNVRIAALEALQKFSREPYVKQQLINALGSQKDPFVQIKLIQILTKMRERSVIGTLHKIIKDQSTISAVKEQAVIGVNKITL